MAATYVNWIESVPAALVAVPAVELATEPSVMTCPVLAWITHGAALRPLILITSPIVAEPLKGNVPVVAAALLNMYTEPDASAWDVPETETGVNPPEVETVATVPDVGSVSDVAPDNVQSRL